MLRGAGRGAVGAGPRDGAVPGLRAPVRGGGGRVRRLPPLQDFTAQVDFKTLQRGRSSPGDECVLGLDVGSTTTKAVLLRRSDQALLASEYLRTNGDPVGASRNCYRSLLAQLRRETEPGSIRIVGLGVTGSGRQIAGLHALTDGVINEIIAHATAAVHFDPEVDTIFEIGGQDAKYTYTHQRGALRLRHERGLLRRHRLLSRGERPSSRSACAWRRSRRRRCRATGRPTSTTSARPSSRRTSRTPSTRASAARTSWPAWSTPSA